MRRQPGFTLIEILVVLGITAILLGVGFASFREYSRRQTLASALRRLSGQVRLAQEHALSGEKLADVRCNTPQVLIGWSLRVSGTTYSVEANCSGGNVTDPNTTVDLSGAGFTISAPSPNPITFKVLGQGTNIASGGTATITLTHTSTGNTGTVIVTSGGEIK